MDINKLVQQQMLQRILHPQPGNFNAGKLADIGDPEMITDEQLHQQQNVNRMPININELIQEHIGYRPAALPMFVDDEMTMNSILDMMHGEGFN